MNLENIGSGGLGGLIGGVLALLGFHNRISRLEKKMDNTVNIKACDIIREDLQKHVTNLREDVQYIRKRMDEMMTIIQMHREDYK
jgi:hypothetical protein